MVIKVQPKDTLFSISRRYAVTVDSIKSINRLSSNEIFIGQLLTIGLPTSQPTTSLDSSWGVFGIQKTSKGDYNQYLLSYPTPNGMDSTTILRDNYPSSYKVNSKGISYVGKSSFNSKIDWFSDSCQEEKYIKILRFISKNEGCFDAVNSYDRAIFSFGFIQFTGAQATGSSLTKVLERFKQKDEYAFMDTFGKYGVNVQSSGRTPIFRLTLENKTTLQGDEAYLKVANDLRLTAMFIASGFRRSMVRAQVDIALQEYVFPAVGVKAVINFKGSIVPLNSILFSEAGLAIRVDLAVNRGLSGSLNVLTQAICQAALEAEISSADELSSIDEKRVIEILAENEGLGSPKGKRIALLLESDFGFDKA